MMKRWIKTFLSLALCAALCLSPLALLPAGAAAGDPVPNGPGGIPDPAFYRALQRTVGASDGQTLTEGDLSGIRYLRIDGMGIRSLEGLGYLPNLLSLSCSDNGISQLDLSLVPNLTVLFCTGNDISQLDLSPVPDLIALYCADTGISQLDLSPVPNLIYLSCPLNRISQLDLSPVPDLELLYCAGTGISQLDLSPVPNLEQLYWGGDNLSQLDLPPLLNLRELSVPGSPNLSSLDLSSVPNLIYLNCGYTGVSFLDLSGLANLGILSYDGAPLQAVEGLDDTALSGQDKAGLLAYIQSVLDGLQPPTPPSPSSRSSNDSNYYGWEAYKYLNVRQSGLHPLTVPEAGKAKDGKVQNVSTVSPEAAAALRAPLLKNDILKSGEILSRTILDPAKVTETIDASVRVGDARTEALFGKYFQNALTALVLPQQGPFGQRVGLAVRVPGYEAPVLYAYDPEANVYSLLPDAGGFYDENGFFHFYTDAGGTYLVVEGSLVK